MCIRTRTSYGCGHHHSTTNHCGVSTCSGKEQDLGRIHYVKESDCRTCKSEGEAGTRGRDGQGLYARRMKRSRTKERSSFSTEDTSPRTSLDDILPVSTATTPQMSYDVSQGPSPWAPSHEKERSLWRKQHRKQADDAWLSEHQDRMSELHGRLEELSVSKHNEPQTPSRQQTHQPDRFDHRPTNLQREIQHYETPRNMQLQVRERLDMTPSPTSHSGSHLRHQRRRDPQYSDESLPDSMPSYRSGSRPTKYRPIQETSYECPREYDYYTSYQASPKPSKRHANHPKPTPYVYSRSPSHDYKSAMVHESPYNYNQRSYSSPSPRYNMVEERSPHYVRYRPDF